MVLQTEKGIELDVFLKFGNTHVSDFYGQIITKYILLLSKILFKFIFL